MLRRRRRRSSAPCSSSSAAASRCRTARSSPAPRPTVGAGEWHPAAGRGLDRLFLEDVCAAAGRALLQAPDDRVAPGQPEGAPRRARPAARGVAIHGRGAERARPAHRRQRLGEVARSPAKPLGESPRPARYAASAGAAPPATSRRQKSFAAPATSSASSANARERSGSCGERRASASARWQKPWIVKIAAPSNPCKPRRGAPPSFSVVERARSVRRAWARKGRRRRSLRRARGRASRRCGRGCARAAGRRRVGEGDDEDLLHRQPAPRAAGGKYRPHRGPGLAGAGRGPDQARATDLAAEDVERRRVAVARWRAFAPGARPVRLGGGGVSNAPCRPASARTRSAPGARTGDRRRAQVSRRVPDRQAASFALVEAGER